MRRAIIAVTGPDRGGLVAWLFTSRAIRRSGGHPLRITPRRGLPRQPFDGLVLGGGADVEPWRYQPWDPAPPVREELAAQPDTRAKLRALESYLLAPLIFVLRRLFSLRRRPPVDRARDTLEVEVFFRALERRLPVLGICRGAQLVNVCFGGTLHRELSSFYTETPNPWTPFPRKPVEIEAKSLLRKLLGVSRCSVNSLHRQAVDRLGTGLRIAACEPSGVVQAIEHAERPFVVGVQWHPEYLPQRPEQRRLFDALVRAARSHSRAVKVGVPGYRSEAPG